MCFYPNLTLTLLKFEYHGYGLWRRVDTFSALQLRRKGSMNILQGGGMNHTVPTTQSGNSDLKPHITIDLHNCVAQKLVPPVAPESGPQAKVVVAKMAKEEMVSNILVNTKEEVNN